MSRIVRPPESTWQDVAAEAVFIAGCVAIIWILAGCGTAPQYEFHVYLGEGAECLAEEAACLYVPRICTASVDFHIECVGYDRSVTESVTFDVERREITIVASGCEAGTTLCDTTRSTLHVADDFSMSGTGITDIWDMDYVVHGSIS